MQLIDIIKVEGGSSAFIYICKKKKKNLNNFHSAGQRPHLACFRNPASRFLHDLSGALCRYCDEGDLSVCACVLRSVDVGVVRFFSSVSATILFVL